MAIRARSSDNSKLSDIEAKESPQEIKRHIEKVIREGSDTFETRHRAKDGEIRDFMISTKAISIRGKTLLCGVWRDITKLKRAERELLDYQAKLRSLASELLSTEERERQRVAAALHDGISQELVMAKLALQSSMQSIPDLHILDALNNVCEALYRMIKDTASLTFEIGNPVLHELGFEAAIERYLAEEIQQKHGMAFELDSDEPLNDLDDARRTCLFRIVRELLVNVVKHAHAHKVRVSTHISRSEIHATVEDDGVGFDPAQAAPLPSKGNGFGLFSIREQLQNLGGRLKIESERGHGSRVTVIIPLKTEDSK